MLYDVSTFMSQESIPSGSDWATVLARELQGSIFTIVCLTPQNLSSPWLLYEAGALTREPEQRLCALLLGGVTVQDIPGPLSRYQHRTWSRDQFEVLMRDIRAILAEPPTEKEFDASLKQHWPEISTRYDELLKKFPPVRLRGVTTTFDRTVMRLPLSEELMGELNRSVEAARTKTRDFIRKQQNIADDCVRANVFVPDYVQTRDGWAFELYMHPRLCRHMDRPQEWPVRFAPGQGATGRAFLEAQQKITPRRDFELPDALRDAIHPELKWIISTPVTSSDGVAFAVLNIDGLKLELDKETVLGDIARLIAEELRNAAHTLDACPKVRVTVQHGEL
jgi:hypothetical protein